MSSTPGDELVDVIDDDGRVIDVVPRREMRNRRLRHRCTYILVFDKLGRLFIHLRTANKDVYPSFWDVCVGGVLTAGESFDESARRECHEEIGIDVTPEPLFLFRYSDDRTIVDGMVYRVVHDGPFALQPEEVACGEFVPLTDIAERTKQVPFCPDGWQVLQEYLNRVGDHQLDERA
jgi:8-oxo-dGTP pyrophosphatase MutT (NUDIX family)